MDISSISKGESKVSIFKLAMCRYITSIIIFGSVLFITAGSVNYWNAWLFLACIFTPMGFTLIYLGIREPDLLAKRMKTKEKEEQQRLFVKLSTSLVIIAYLIPGFDYRFKWSGIPVILVVIFSIVLVAGYIIFIFVLKQNHYASRIIEIQNNQEVITTGLYSYVRHPMYLASFLIIVSSPFVLGSYYALIPMIPYIFLFSIRIHNEEEVLITGLKGYKEYMEKVKYRILPFIW